jgi:membrane-associated protease RseP (regulator of RpoE activity)
MKFIIYDVILLVIFVAFIAHFLYKNKKNLKRDGLLYLYRTKWGMNLIDRVGKKYKKTLHVLSYVSITIGYLLMAGMLWLVGKLVYLYIAYPNIVQAIKVPPIMPLIPYLPQAFNLDFLPDFYFINFIVILAIIAIPHEFAHGIFMRRYGIKIKSTGFGFFPFFLPVFLAAFVEQDEKSMNKGKSFHQMAVLSAGTFANIITAVVFFGIMFLFFTLSFAPAGVQFTTYSYSFVNPADIISINGIQLDNPTYNNLIELSIEEGFNEIKTQNGNYIITKEFLAAQKENYLNLVVYDDAPAIRADLEGPIIGINGQKITNWEEFGEIMQDKSPGDKIIVNTIDEEQDMPRDYEITLAESNEEPGKAFLGVGYSPTQRNGAIGKLVDALSSFKKQELYYEGKFEASEFIYNMLWWLVLIVFSVALVNMLPAGIFDGGRFFYLTVLGISTRLGVSEEKSEKIAQRSFRVITWFFLFLLALIMFFWVKSFF